MSSFNTLNAIIPVPIFGGNPRNITLSGFFLPANWNKSISISTLWDTVVLPNQEDGEARRGNTSKPSRTIKVDVLASSIDQVGRMQGYLQRSGLTRFLAPLYPDQASCLNNAFGAENAFLPIDLAYPLQYHRFEVGKYAIVYEPNTERFATLLISAINLATNTLTFETAVGFETNRNTLVLPVIESKLILGSSSAVVTDRVVTAEIEGQELPGKGVLAPSHAPNQTPAGYPEYSGKPIMDTPSDSRRPQEVSYSRTGRYHSVGNTQVESVYGDRMRQSRKFSLLFFSRPEFWKFLQFFDSRAGRLFSWWLPSFTHDYEITAFLSNGLKVKSFGPIEDWEARPYISILSEDGTTEIRTIESISTNNQEDTLILDSAFTTDNIVNVSRAGQAQLVRFAKDEMVENWITDMVVQVNVETLELVEETVITLANYEEVATTGLSAKYSPQECLPDSTDCDPACDDCANCRIAASSTVTISFSDIVPLSNQNGLTTQMADFLLQNTPFVLPLASSDNDYKTYRLRTDAFNIGIVFPFTAVTITMEVRLDCLTGGWSWSYFVTVAGVQQPTFRACGDCLLSGAGIFIDCGPNANTSFYEDCWNTHFHQDIEAYTNLNANNNRNICTGIVGWSEATVASPNGNAFGADDTGTEIMRGIRGEWTLANNASCCASGDAGGPCIPCLNSCLIELDCSKGQPSESTTGCFERYLGLPALDGGFAFTCSNCAYIVVYTGGNASCCNRSSTQLCPRISVRAATPGCLGCNGDPDFDFCPRRLRK